MVFPKGNMNVRHRFLFVLVKNHFYEAHLESLVYLLHDLQKD